MPSNSEIITHFCTLCSKADIEAIMDSFTEDAVYTNIPVDPPNVGKEMIRQAVEMFIGMGEKVEFVITHQAETAEGIVMNERIDRFYIGEAVIELPVMGVFEIRDNKISAWRDYFDINQFMSQIPE